MNEHGPPPLQPVISNAFGAGRAIRHGFFTRAGGVSEGLYAGLNAGLGSADDQDHVRENRRRIAGWFGVGEIALSGCHQVHSADVVTIDAPIPIAVTAGFSYSEASRQGARVGLAGEF